MAKRLALITGAGRTAGIGAAIARKIASDGWDLAINYWTPYDARMTWGVRPDETSLLKEELVSLGAHVLAIPSDLELPTSAALIFKEIDKNNRRASALVLSHCESVDSGILDTTVESFDRHFAVNVRASWQLIREFANQVPSTGGSVVALTSDHTVHNLPYGASKGALDRIVIAAARELAHLRITSNVVNPGPVDTGWMDESTREKVANRQPGGRLGTPLDTANLVSFLLSPAGSWMNGQLIKSDGGFST